MSILSLAKIKEFFLKYEAKIVLIIAFCLVSAISYEFGVLQGQKWQQKPLIIEKQVNTPQEGQTVKNEASSTSQTTSSSVVAKTAATTSSMNSCAFVGSKNSDKFYLPTCSYAKRVKPENLVCYKSEQEALGKGKIKSDCK